MSNTFRCVRCQQEINTGAFMCPWCHGNPFSGEDYDPPKISTKDVQRVDVLSFFFFVGGLIYLISWNGWTEYLGLGMLIVFVVLFIRFLQQTYNESH
jgi:hypothetical protein